MFPRRSDAKPVDQLSNMRRMMPFVSPRRNDSVFYMFQDIDRAGKLDDVIDSLTYQLSQTENGFNRTLT